MLFYRHTTEGRRLDCTDALKGLYASPEAPMACWIIGSAPSLSSDEVELINASDISKFACNNSGRGSDGQWLIRPDFWTAYDPTARFLPTTFTDPRITKFVRHGKEMDLIPASSHKLCDAPNTFFFDSELRDFTNFFKQDAKAINNSLDSFIQMLDIAFMLGFRTFYLAGVSLQVNPSKAQIEYAKGLGVDYDPISGVTKYTLRKKGDDVQIESDLLSDFIYQVAVKGHNGVVSAAELALSGLEREKQYSFGEMKSIKSAAMTDKHYHDRAQYLRLSRKNMTMNGVSLVVCGRATSRLDEFFPMCTVAEIAENEKICEQHSPAGLYTGKEIPNLTPYHSDVKPYAHTDKLQEDQDQPVSVGPVSRVVIESKPPEDKIQSLKANKVSINEEL